MAETKSLTGSGAEQVRRPYAEPAIRRVPLRSEEAVLSVCKTLAAAGSSQPVCGIAAGVGQCSSLGS
jgi:hypothetical protein